MELKVNDNNPISLGVSEDNIGLRSGDTINIGTSDYEALINKPSINEVELVGDKSADDLGLAEAEHTHVKADVTDFAHDHVKADITDFAHSHTKSDISDFSHTHTKSDVTDFAHNHTKSDITDFAHNHTKSEITDFPSLATVATSGNYNDLTNKPTIPNPNLFIVNVGYDVDEDEYYLIDTTYDDICNSYDGGVALLLIYTDEDDYAYEYVLSNYAKDDDFITFASSSTPAVVDTFTINSDDSVDFLQSTARTSALVNDSLFVRGNSAVWEGTCSTVASTSAKYVNCSSFTADDQDVGTIVFVTFANTNSAAVSGLTLNVQNRGAKPIKCLKNGQVANLDNASDLTGTLPFFYDGTNWVTWYDTNTDAKVYQQYQAASGYTYWRPLVIGKSSNGTEGFTPSSTTDQTYVFTTLQVQPSSGTIRMGGASMFKGSYESKISPTTLTADRTLTIPDKSGTLALTSDITGGGMSITVNGVDYPITAITLTTISGVEGVLVDYDDGNSGQLFLADGVGLNAVKVAIEATIPHDTSELTNGAGFITISDLPIYNGGVS